MYTDDYREFKKHIKNEHLPAIQRALAKDIRIVAWEMFGEPEMRKNDALYPFFKQVLVKTGEITNHNSDEYFHNLIKQWNVTGSKSLVIATYYFLHTVRSGQELASKIDQILFKKSFFEAHGTPVPGGFVPPNSEIGLPAKQEILEAIQKLSAANLAEGVERASFELLLRIAREYDDTHVAANADELHTYLKLKVEEWRVYRKRFSELQIEDVEDRALLLAARDATDRGDFETADALILESECRFDGMLESAARAKCERLSLRADNARLSGNNIEASKLLYTASELVRLIDPVLSFAHAHNATNALNERAFNFGDISLMEVAQRYRKLVDLANTSDIYPDWQRVRPLLSYCSILSTISVRSTDRQYALEAESECRAALAVYASHVDTTIPAYLRSVLGQILQDDKRHIDYRQRLEEALVFHRAASASVTPESAIDFWCMFQTRLALNLMDLANFDSGTNLWRQAATEFSILLEKINRNDKPQEWSRAHHNLGVCLRVIGQREKNVGDVEKSLIHLEYALEERAFERSPELFARTRSAIGESYLILAWNFSQPEMLEFAINAFRDALKWWKKESAPRDWFHTTQKQIKSLSLFALWTNDKSLIDEAEQLGLDILGSETELICKNCSNKNIGYIGLLHYIGKYLNKNKLSLGFLWNNIDKNFPELVEYLLVSNFFSAKMVIRKRIRNNILNHIRFAIMR